MCKRGEGFTLLEVLVVLAIASIVLCSTLFFNTTMYRSVAFQAERNSIISLLKQTRSEAMNNMKRQSHGVAFFPDGFNGYVTFVGDNFESSESAYRAYIPVQYPIGITAAAPLTVVFEARSGVTNFAETLILSDRERPDATTSIVINHEGYVGW